MISPERLDAMQGQWVRLVAAFGVAPADAYPPFDRLVAAYTAPDRHYHTLEHLGEMFRVAGRLAAHTRDPLAVQLAIWFHDAVYDPRAKDSEARSAALAADELTALGVPPATVEAVQRLVTATAHLLGDAPPADPDAAVVIDADLAILGAADARYRRYAADVRREYAFVPDADYRTGRAAVLRRFLARPRIYHHDVLFEEGEARARENLTAELRELGT
ncbi:HD domain-containing protein [Gemmata sp.]|uniref:HD domain-containing protein n=1 Tax=Gemmata sp. TaxID=1914242 RepID=UPI003F727459